MDVNCVNGRLQRRALSETLPRLLSTGLAQWLRVMPAVVVAGARQTRKSTLAEHLVIRQPAGFLASAEAVDWWGR